MKKLILMVFTSLMLAGCAVPNDYINPPPRPHVSYRFGYWIGYGWDNDYPYYYNNYPYSIPDEDRQCCYEHNWDNDGWHHEDHDRPHH
jgi:hypothetical protein